ncbi:MAG TPA: hypothetical protein VFB63_19515 [Bryobacteraceae bacterium]|nr:hypothetical protein [Bryobacteraceae bacterium]
MSAKELVSPFRLAFRSEGEFVRCYLAQQGTMESAELLATVRRTLLDASPELWATYRSMMEDAARLMVREVLGVEVAEFNTTPAPEHEKSGNA